MFRYSAKIRLSGSVLNEVIKENMSAAEVMILRRLHGNDALIGLQEVTSDKTPHEQELEYLKKTYCSSSQNRTKINFEQMFPEHIPLPNRLRDFDVKEEPEAPKMDSRTRSRTKVDDSVVSVSDIAG